MKTSTKTKSTSIFRTGDALLITDLQIDFCEGGALAVPGATATIPVANELISEASLNDCPIFATRDHHPPNHISFKAQGITIA